jgi:predicted short-subunit dehydrogenase-like oxidoreductase (DUF2520 family)
VSGPWRRGERMPDADVVLLAIPERELAAAAAAIPAGPLLGHCSASASLDLLAPAERFNLHPLMTLNAMTLAGQANQPSGEARAGEIFRGAACAVDSSTERARDVAMALAERLGMRPVVIPAAQRPLYHAAASMTANYLVTLEAAAERLARHTGITRAELAPLARASLEAWIAGGFSPAISGPVSRGDDDVVEGQRAAVARAEPALLPLFDALTIATRDAMHLTAVPSTDEPDNPATPTLRPETHA